MASSSKVLAFQRDWNAYCALSLVHFMAYPECQGGEGPILETVARIADDDFFSAIELSRINDDTVRSQTARLIDQSHMQVAFGAQPIILGSKLNLNASEASERDCAVNVLKTYIAQAAEIGAQQFVILSGANVVDPYRLVALKSLSESIRQLCAYGQTLGVRIILETFDQKVDKKALVGPANEAASLAQAIRIDFPNFGILYDMGHMPLLDESPQSALGELKACLVHAHVGNCVKVSGRTAFGDTHPRFGFPGSENDVLQLVEFLRALYEVGYLRENIPTESLPWIGFEIRPQADEEVAVILANIKRTWRAAWWEA